MRNISKIMALIAVVGASFWQVGCDKGVTETALVSQSQQGTPIKLGKQLPNPYSVEAMRNAYKSLEKKGKLRHNKSLSSIVATHLYVKFKPKTWAEYDSLRIDRDLVLSDYPLDYELASGGDYYSDAPTADGVGSQYVALPVNYPFRNDVEKEVLADLYMPEDANNKAFFEDLEGESKILVGFPEEQNKSASTFKPSGSVTALDKRIGRFMPIEGVSVIIRRSMFRIYTTTTDENGNYQFDVSYSVGTQLPYRIMWERDNFEVRSGKSGTATHTINGTGVINFSFSDVLQTFYATIFKAAHIYYYKNTYGIQPPPINEWYRPRLKIAAHEAADLDFAGDYNPFRRYTLGITPDINI
jgi:hypothetical protein